MPKIVKLSDLSKKEKEKILQQTKKEVEERKAKIENEISFISKNKSNNSIQLPTAKNTTKTTTKLPIGPMPTQQSGIKRNVINNTKASIKDIANDVVEHKKEKEEKNKFVNKSGVSNIASNVGHIAKSTGVGAVEGTAGIIQGVLTDTANQFNKGSEKDIGETSVNFLKSITGITNPGYNITNIAKDIPNKIKSILPIIADKDKSVLEKATSIALDAVSDAKNNSSIGRFVNSANQLTGSINKDAGKSVMEVNEKISLPINKMKENIAEEREKYNGFTQTIGQLGQTVGNMTPSIVASKITGNPTIALGTMGLSVKGQATQEALNKGATLDEAVKIGDTKAMIEVGTEMLTGGVNIFGKGALDDIIEKRIDRKVKNQVVNFLIKKGLDIPEEIIEETISDVLNTTIDKGTVDPNASYSFKDWSDTALITTLSTVVLNAIGGGYGKNAYLQNAQKLQQQNRTNLPTQQTIQEQNNIVENNQETSTNFFNGYTEKEINNIKSDKISIANNNDDIVNFVNNSKKFPGNFKLYVGKIAQNTANIIKNKFGINVEGYNISLKTDAIRHSLNNHNITTENLRGQVPITENDFKNIPEIINSPDNIETSGITKQGKPVIKFEKNIDGNNVVITYTSDKHKNLELQTMYKFKNDKKIDSFTATGETSSSVRTSETDSDTNLINNSISQLTKNVKDNSIINNNSMQNFENNTLPTPEKTMQEVGASTATDKPKKLTRKAVRKQLIQEMNITEEDLQSGNDIKSLNFQLTDPVRVNEKVFGQEMGQKINDVTINRTKHNTAEKTRWLNKERSEISELEIKARSKESAAVQKYGEKKYVNEAGETQKYGDKELAQEFSNKETQEKIKKAAKAIREKYDIYIEQINEVLTSLGYDAIPKREDYMRHFQELGDMFSQTGVPFNLNDMKAEDLPTDINGLTEFNKPGKNWFASSQKRYGNQTTYDAITGIDGYLEGAGNLIYHTEDIQRYRALSELIRNTFGQTKGFENLNGLSDEQLQQRIEDIQNNKLSKYVAWLDEQANSLSGKKASIDRSSERILGRRVYTLMNTLKKQVGSNMTGFNVRSALTNLISSTIAAGKTNKIALAKGTISTINNMFKNDGFIDKSDFLTSRFGSDSLSQKLWQKISNAGQIFMTGTDYFTSNIIARSKYYEGLQRGMTEQQAMRYSNDFSSRVMGDRSQGATAEAFNSKALGLFTQFQLEVNNQWQYMIHDTKMDYQKNSANEGKVKAGATVLFQLGQIAAYSYFFNELFESLTGSRAAFDPIEIIKVLFGLDDEDKEKSFSERATEAMGLLVDNIPFGNLITGGGRIPIADALTGPQTLIKKITGQRNSYGGEITWKDVQDDMLSSAPYWAFPTGYGAIKKSTQGINTIINGGDYVTNSKGEKELRFPIEDKKVGDYIKAATFGKYALPLAKEYINRDYERLSAKQTETYEVSNLPYKEFLQYIDANLSTKQEKLNYLNKQDWNDNQKWGIFTRDILSSTKRKDGTSQLSDAQYIIKTGISKKKFMQLYNKANEYDISIPTEEDYKELRKEGTTLEEYINEKIVKKKKKANK